METFDPSKYLNERGHNVLLYEDQLRALGLNVVKTEFGKLYPPGASGGIFSLYDLKFEKKDEKFSDQLSAFLRDKIGLKPEDIERLQTQAVLAPDRF
ncbi:MAG: hypothetical protein ABSD88_07050 [Candidatus Korobacteraceae bacterium]|jgi:hypothetical protein